jgi:hypothetical protein
VRSTDMWEDYLPIGIETKGMRQLFYQFTSSFYPRLASANYVGQWQSQNTLLGLLSLPYVKKKIQSSVTFGTHGELLTVDVGNSSLRRFLGK